MKPFIPLPGRKTLGIALVLAAVSPFSLVKGGGPLQTADSLLRSQPVFIKTNPLTAGAEPLRLDFLVSRKRIGTDKTQDLPLVIRFGQPTIDPRSAGKDGHHQLVLTFSKPILAGFAEVESGNGALAMPPSITGKKMIIDLENVKDGEVIKVGLVHVLAADATSYDGEISFRPLKGDLNGDGLVNADDVKGLQKKLRNPRLWRKGLNLDLDLDGKIDQADLELIKVAAAKPLAP